MDNREVCINCEHYRPFKGVYECQNTESDYMYKTRLPDDGCLDFERKEERKKQWVKTAEH